MGAMPNTFEFIIAAALAKPKVSAESVATAIAQSQEFLRAISAGLARPANSEILPEKYMRSILAKAFSAPTAQSMFDR